MTELLNRFEIIEQLGCGGFSRVYKVESKKNGEVYALKILDIETPENDNTFRNSKEYQEFINEVNILQKLNSPNIVKVYEQMVLDGKLCILMEYIEGDTLEDILQKEIILSKDETLKILLEVSAALTHCHNLQYNSSLIGYSSETQILRQTAIIHNDIHPKNIIKNKMPNGMYRYVLIDFGLSFVDTKNIKEDNQKNGLAEYKSPEKWLKNELLPSSDIYSFGILLYRCLAGKEPFVLENPCNIKELESVKNNHLNDRPDNLWLIRKKTLQEQKELFLEKPDYPKWLDDIIFKCLDKNPRNRFKTGLELNKQYHKGFDGKLNSAWEIPAPIKNNIVPKVKKELKAWLIVHDEAAPSQSYDLKLGLNSCGRNPNMPNGNLIKIETNDKYMSRLHFTIEISESKIGYDYILRDCNSTNGTYIDVKNLGNYKREMLRVKPRQNINLINDSLIEAGRTKIHFKYAENESDTKNKIAEEIQKEKYTQTIIVG
uniref:FHA domain-containing serine/threonine-protein kinase n=1 Tax=Ornithobacterium rhinotracheale TaxID=28251 RepID=UPI0039A5C08A